MEKKAYSHWLRSWFMLNVSFQISVKKKDCFKLKLIAPKSSSVLSRTIFGFFRCCRTTATNTQTHERAVLFPFGEREYSVGYLWQACRQAAIAKTRYIAHSCEHRERQNGTQYDLWAYIIHVTYGDVFSAPKRVHTIYFFYFSFFRFWISCCGGWLLLLLKTLFLLHFNINVCVCLLRWKFIIGCNSTCMHLFIVPLRSPIALHS